MEYSGDRISLVKSLRPKKRTIFFQASYDCKRRVIIASFGPAYPGAMEKESGVQRGLAVFDADGLYSEHFFELSPERFELGEDYAYVNTHRLFLKNKNKQMQPSDLPISPMGALTDLIYTKILKINLDTMTIVNTFPIGGPSEIQMDQSGFYVFSTWEKVDLKTDAISSSGDLKSFLVQHRSILGADENIYLYIQSHAKLELLSNFLPNTLYKAEHGNITKINTMPFPDGEYLASVGPYIYIFAYDNSKSVFRFDTRSNESKVFKMPYQYVVGVASASDHLIVLINPTGNSQTPKSGWDAARHWSYVFDQDLNLVAGTELPVGFIDGVSTSKRGSAGDL
jgi:hypothetical protein